jgi:hypothetical protein
VDLVGDIAVQLPDLVRSPAGTMVLGSLMAIVGRMVRNLGRMDQKASKTQRRRGLYNTFCWAPAFTMMGATALYSGAVATAVLRQEQAVELFWLSMFAVIVFFAASGYTSYIGEPRKWTEIEDYEIVLQRALPDALALGILWVELVLLIQLSGAG